MHTMERIAEETFYKGERQAGFPESVKCSLIFVRVIIFHTVLFTHPFFIVSFSDVYLV